MNTDVIFPGKYTYTVTDRKEMAKHALEDLDPRFAKEVRPGDVVAAGANFGCGSSREQAATCIKETGCGAVVAKSFSRLFFRNAINEGLPALTFIEAADAIEAGETVEIDLDAGTISCAKGTFRFAPLNDFVLGILRDGGLIPHVKKKLAAKT